MNIILHITQYEKWEEAKLVGMYCADSFESEGFIHCSTPQQITKVAERFFAGQNGLVLLLIDAGKVKPEIRYEAAEENELFPHIYGALNVDAVFQVVGFECGEDGKFKLPQEVGSLMNRQDAKDAEIDNQGLDVGEYVDLMALLVDLRLRDEYRDGVVANFERIKAIAQLVNSFPLPEDIEVAPVFEP